MKSRIFATAILLSGVSHVAAARVANEKVERPAADKIVVAWTSRTPVDVFVADAADAAIEKAKLVSDDNKKGRFEFTVDPKARPYFFLKDEGDKSTAEVAERLVPLEQGSNFRDLGGYATADGRHVRWGLLFRSGATALLSDADLDRVKALALTDMVDLRSNEERSVAPSKIEDVRYAAIGYSMERMMTQRPVDVRNMGALYRNFPTFLAPQMRVLFDKLLQDETRVAYNCSAGQDRTGFATALILSALGVPRDTIFADYQLSTTYRRPQFETPKLDPAAMPTPGLKYFASLTQNQAASKPQPLLDPENKPFLASALNEIDVKWGSVEAYLEKEVGVDKADIAKLKAKYLE